MASEMMEAILSMITDMEMQDFYENGDFVQMRAVVDEMCEGQAVSEGVNFTPLTLNGVETEMAATITPDTGVIVLYLHGGANITGNALGSRGYASDVADVSNYPVYSVTYRLCPENPFPAAPDDCFAVYEALLEKYPGWKVVVIGDSAGGTLVLDVALLAREAGVQMPSLLCMFSPVTEVSEDLPSRISNKEKDLCVRHCINDDYKKYYCPGMDAGNVLISPLRADFRGFPPMQITVDRGEILLDDSLLLAEKAKVAGVDVYFTLFEDCFHAFPAGGKLTPESMQILEETTTLIKKYCI